LESATYGLIVYVFFRTIIGSYGNAWLFYEMATFTIVAAGNENGFEGLEGVPPTRRSTQSRTVKDIIPGLKMTAFTDVDVLLPKSVYQTRAWT
jgi:hypothetical protein